MNIAELFSTSTWIWVDYTIMGIVLMSALIGLIRGFVKEAFSLLIWGVATVVSSIYSHEVSALFQNTVSLPAARIALAFALLFVTILVMGSLISFIISQLVHKTGLTGSDRLLGMIFGVVRGAILVAILVVLAGFTPLPQDAWWHQSKLLPTFQSLAVWLKEHIPANMADYIKFH